MKQVLLKNAGACKTLKLYSQEFGYTKNEINYTSRNTAHVIGSAVINTTHKTFTFMQALPYTSTSTACIVGLASTDTGTYPTSIIGVVFTGTFNNSGTVFTTNDPITGNGLTGRFAVVEANEVDLISVSDIEYEYYQQYFILVNDLYDDRLEYYDNTTTTLPAHIIFHRPRKKLHISSSGTDALTVYLVDPALINTTTSYNPTSFTLNSEDIVLDTTMVNWQTAFVQIWLEGGETTFKIIAY